MTTDPVSLLTQYRAQYSTYKELVERVKSELSSALSDLGIKAIDGRAKDPAHFVLKALKKQQEKPEEYADPLSAMPDKAGVRVIVNHLDDVQECLSRIRRCFVVIDVDDKR
ncbi:MAG TPA: hypothetical protein VK507_10940, partial [Iamia sp.]|nr:hypothetical protein [Iamia sp.]